MTAIDRRGFLLGVAAVAGVRWWADGVPAGATSPALSARRAATFRALLRSLRDAPHSRFRALGVAAAERRFARWYAGEGAAGRARADAVLDALGRWPVPRYDRLARAAAVSHSDAAARRAGAIAAAVDLVGMICEPPPGEDERPPSPALELAG